MRGGSAFVLVVEVRGFEPLASSVRDLYRAFPKELRGVEDRGNP
jgi:hypothetical protein